MRMDIGTSLNSKYMRYTYVMLLSFLQNQKADNDIHIYLMHSDLTEYDQNCIRELVEQFSQSVDFIEIDASCFPDSFPTTQNWTQETYYRLMLAERLPVEVKRFLYLDVDIIVNQPLDELFDIDFEGNCLCACPDAFGSPFPDIRQEVFAEQIRQGFSYFNAGVMLIDMGVFREKYCFQSYLDLAKSLDYKLYAQDQDLLNYMHWRETKLLDASRYDLYAKSAYRSGVHYDEVKEQTAIIHYTGEKPWQGQFAHYDIEQLWWDYAYQTPFAEALMKEYMDASINNPYLYDSIIRLSDANSKLVTELKESMALCQRLLAMKTT